MLVYFGRKLVISNFCAIMESTVNAADNETSSQHCLDGSEASEVEVVNWQQLEDDLFAGKNASKHQSRLSVSDKLLA